MEPLERNGCDVLLEDISASDLQDKVRFQPKLISSARLLDSYFKVTENDPVMGGVSNSNSSVGSSELAWDGEVKIVPSLDAPGFCLIYTEGVNRFSDASAYSALTLKVRQNMTLTESCLAWIQCLCLMKAAIILNLLKWSENLSSISMLTRAPRVLYAGTLNHSI
jgi:hypothetical protein